MKKDVLALADLKYPQKGPSKETLNHAGLIKLASGIDPLEDTKNAYLKAYESLGIDIINRVPEENAIVPLKDGEVVDLGNGYKKASLGLYDTVMRYRYPFENVDDFWNAQEINPNYHELITGVPHKLNSDVIKRKEKIVGDIGVYYYQLYTTFFMWGVEYLGWEVYMLAAAMDPEGFKEKFLDVVWEESLTLIKELCEVDCPFVFCHDDLADARGPVFHPDWYDKYIFPRYAELWEPVKKAGKKVIFVADGNMAFFIESLRETGIDGFMFENPATDFDLMLKQVRDKIVIGGIDTKLLTFGTTEEITKHVMEVHEKTKDIPGFAMSTPGGIHGNIPLKNLEAYFNARVKTGHTLEGWRKL